MTNVGWKTLELVPKNTAGQVATYKDFGRAYAIRFVQGAQHLAAVALRNGNDQPLSVSELYDTHVEIAPNYFDELEVTWPTDIFPGLTRATVQVLTRPAITLAAGGEKGMQSARRIFPSVLHSTPGSAQGSVSIAAGAASVVCDVPGSLWQYPNNAGTGVQVPYISRMHSDTRAPWWPAPDLYFDGYVAAVENADFEVWIYAYSFTNASTPRLHFYRKITTPEDGSTGAPTVTPTPVGLFVKRFEAANNVPVPMACPADGFQMLVKNVGAVELTVYGYIGARSV